MPKIRRLVETIQQRYTPASNGYECGGCSMSFDREPLNCPACGCPVINESNRW